VVEVRLGCVSGQLRTVARGAGAAFLPRTAASSHGCSTAFLVDKAFYELGYETRSTGPTWARISAVAGF